VSGPGAERCLDSILTSKIPKAINRVSLTYLLTKQGGVRAEFTLASWVQTLDRVCGSGIRTISLHRPGEDFFGKDARLKWRDKSFANKLVTLELFGVEDF
jgi:glycine cleavage system aminomethyltransferase T